MDRILAQDFLEPLILAMMHDAWFYRRTRVRADKQLETVRVTTGHHQNFDRSEEVRGPAISPRERNVRDKGMHYAREERDTGTAPKSFHQARAD